MSIGQFGGYLDQQLVGGMCGVCTSGHTSPEPVGKASIPQKSQDPLAKAMQPNHFRTSESCVFSHFGHEFLGRLEDAKLLHSLSAAIEGNSYTKVDKQNETYSGINVRPGYGDPWSLEPQNQ
jgi:hypothetical protein